MYHMVCAWWILLTSHGRSLNKVDAVCRWLNVSECLKYYLIVGDDVGMFWMMLERCLNVMWM